MRRQLRRQVLAVLSHDGPAPDYDAPKGDAGLFGPDSITWKIHADFPSMMAGGLASLMLQMLHPLAMAGVWDHSSFQHDILGRLRRTTAFVGRTTYAPSAPAEAIIEHVRRVHLHVVGTALDGRPYRADDPHLLTWVQCAEAWCFLKAYRAYCHADIPVPLQDRYLAEFARVAEALGARDVPKTLADLTAFFDAERAQLVFDERCATVLRTLDSIDLPIPLAGLGRRMFLGAAASLLPDWALDLMQRPPRERMRDHVGAASLKLMAPSIRDAMAEGGLAWRACRRTDADYAGLFRWPKDAP
ncbi:MAG TPA: oxygenase MpaB family protein [Rhodanobacteraceae bacterium]